MTNKYLPHVYVLPEDDANRQIVNGFFLNPYLKTNAINSFQTLAVGKRLSTHSKVFTSMKCENTLKEESS